jgi:hypothetical protein
MADVPPIAMKAADAKRFIGATDRRWKALLHSGDLKPNKVGSFNVADLKALTQNDGDGQAESGRAVCEEQANTGGKDMGIRGHRGRGNRRSAKEALHELDALIQQRRQSA